MDWDGNRIDKLGKMIYIWSQFFIKVLQIIILDIKEWDKNKCRYSKENSSLQQRIYIYIMECMISIKIPQKGKNKNLSRELQKDKSIQTLSPAIHLEGWGKHFEHEYRNKPSKNLIESWKTNEWSQCSLKGPHPLLIESNVEFQ